MYYAKEQLCFVLTLMRDDIEAYFAKRWPDKYNHLTPKFFNVTTISCEQNMRRSLKDLSLYCVNLLKQIDGMSITERMQKYALIKVTLMNLVELVSKNSSHMKSKRLPKLIPQLKCHLELLIEIPDEPFAPIEKRYLLLIARRTFGNAFTSHGIFHVREEVRICSEEYSICVSRSAYDEYINPLLTEVLGHSPAPVNYLQEDQLRRLKEVYLEQTKISNYVR